MRKVIDFNDGWEFSRNEDFVEKETVNLPHTWNAKDGQDGGDDYYRGACWYRKTFDAPEGKNVYIRFYGANHMADVWCNGKKLGQHRGGFSAFVYELTDLKSEDNTLLVRVENSAKLPIYPQQADFTFFGGIYRPVELVCLEEAHFSMEKLGSEGLFVTPGINGDVRVNVFLAGGKKVSIRILSMTGEVVAEGDTEVSGNHAELALKVEHPKLWQAMDDPYLYTCEAVLENGADKVTAAFGFREYVIDPQKGFFLNGREYPLHGASRHQDRENMGWAIGQKEHAEDIKIMTEMGVNTIRLAHYQHAKPFYDLCDETGLVTWAEIPMISSFMPDQEAVENTYSQMRELIVQNYNHPSIIVWGIANEITIGGLTKDLEANLKELNRISKELDPSRPTTMACIGTTKPGDPLCYIADVIGFNLYFGWYKGAAEELDEALDEYHAVMPDKAISVSEYGAEAVMGWHSDEPKCQDYTEEYQALLHEKALETFEKRPYLWASWIWNMFDFAADARDEGGCKGRNNKGMVTYDRAIKKDAYYIYKAYWSKQPFVYICGRRYAKRHQEGITVKVYSNCPLVTLSVNGTKVASKEGSRIFIFEDVVLRKGENVLHASAAGADLDVVVLEKVDEPNQDYVLSVDEAVLATEVTQWFANLTTKGTELKFPDGCYSVRDELGVLMGNQQTKEVVDEILIKPLTLAAQAQGKSDGGTAAALLAQASEISIQDLWLFLKKGLPENALLILNERLNDIKKLS